jgi:ParB family transcriptional regulator, chromosome partitioning protein
MSVTESKAKPAKKATRKKATSVVSAELVSALESAEVRHASYSRLFIGELNSRLIPHTPEEIQGYADSILAVGLLQNLVVVECEDGRLEVVCGGGRTKAIGLLVEAGKVDPDKDWILYKAVPRHLARAASMTENGKRKNMHPAEQIVGFRGMSADGNTPAQIGDLLGYGARHVQRMLKLAGLAPAILDSLARDDLSTEHCHVLALEDSHERQLQVLEMATERSYNGKPQLNDIRNLITASEVRIADSRKFAFVGASAFADGQIRRDLFSEDNDGYVDRVLLETHVTNKLEMIAHALQDCEGWAWCLHRESAVSHWGVDAQQYVFLPEPTPLFTDAERARTEALTAALEQTETHDDEYDIQQQIEDLDAAVVIRSWTAEQKAQAGVVVSFERGEVCIQRGVMVRQHDDAQTEAENTVTTYEQPPEPADEISLPLLTKMSAERTLAVQATLMQQREKAVALLTWTLCLNVFSSCTYSKPAKISLTCEHYSLTTNAPEGKNGQAYTAMMQEKDRLSALLPEGWARDFTTFFTLNGEMLLSLLGFCVACSIDGTQTREYGRTSKSPLDKLEVALGFHLRDWWQPGSDNFFSHMKKPQIVAALNEAGLTGAASDAEKMKKGDAADLAETMMARIRWVPVWMKAPDATERPDPASDTDNPTAHAA